MTARKRTGRWYFRRWVKLPNGKRVRIFGVPSTYNLPNTRTGAEEAERRAATAAITGSRTEVPASSKTFAQFEATFIEHSEARNKPRSVNSKKQILRDHIMPKFGPMPLAAATFGDIEDFKHALLAKPLVAKTANNVLTVLHALLMLAKKRGYVVAVPEFEWLRPDPPEFDFLTFEEADALVKGADDGEWTTMIYVAIRTGLRQGELLALRWEDVDLERHVINVSRSVSRGHITTPKSRKGRCVELGDDVTAMLRRHRHLRGPLVFCDADGAMWPAGACKHPLYRAARRAKLRQVGWHVLRHTFGSHLAMRGASANAIRELMGHTSLTTTLRYMHLSPASRRDVVRLLDGAQMVPDTKKKGGI